MAVAVIVLCMSLGLCPVEAAAPAGDDLVETVCLRFCGYDYDGDGVVEIRTLEPLVHAGERGRRVLVLVEKRLLDPLEGARALGPLVERLASDLGAEGYRADAIRIELGRSKQHQDGRYLLAIRELFRAVAEKDGLAGALLVGHFPDALLVRTCNWRRNGPLALRKKEANQKKYKKIRYLRRVPEEAARRSELVLCDLDGRWEDVYVQPRTRLEAIHAVYPEGIPAGGGPPADFEQRYVTFEDFFHVADGRIEVSPSGGAPDGPVARSLSVDDSCGDRECGAADRLQPNVIARPDILVSRIDARGVALRPRRDVVGVDGGGLLDERRRPRAVRFASPEAVPDWREAIWEPDAALERRLLAEYLDRNHAFRTGATEVAWRPASFACDLGSGYKVMRRAADDWERADAAGGDVHGRPTLAQFSEWLRYPAILRTVRAHSDPAGSRLRRGGLDEIESRQQGRVWSWTRRGDRLEPSLAAACRRGQLNWFLLRTLWENGDVAPEPAFYHHTGCNGISPPGARHLPYDHPSYGLRQGAESLLLFAGGLALVGRAKVYNDEPRGFAEALRAGRTFGEAWARYFEIESSRKPRGGPGADIGRKRAYCWSVLGDWTLRLTRPDRNEP